MRMILIAALVAVAAPAFAQQVYTWEDKDGIHYTDDPTQVPKGAKVASEKLAARSSSATAPSPSPAPEVAPATTPRATALDERRWRDRFIEAYRRVDTLKQSINALASSIPAATTCTTVQQQAPTGTAAAAAPIIQQQCYPNQARDRMLAELAQKKVDLKDAELDIDRLEREATMAQVPREWRRGW